MTSLRRLSNGKWNKSPILYAARRIVFEALHRNCETVRLSDTASFVNGTTYDSSFLRETGTPIIRISNISNPLSDSLKTIEGFDSKFYIEKGDLLVSWSASFKSILWPGEPGVLNQHIFKVTEKQGFSKDYLRHAIEYVFDDLQQKVVGIGMMHLRRQDFLGHQIPAPDIEMQLSVARYLTWVEDGVGDEPFLPLPEQRRIVARVKEMLAKVEEARGLRQLNLSNADLLLSQMTDASLQTNNLTRLGELTAGQGFQNGYSPRASDDGPVLGLTLAAVRNGVIDPRMAKRVGPERDYQDFLARRGDIFIVRGSGSRELVGQAAIFDADIPIIFPDLLIRISLNTAKIDAEYFVKFWNSNYGRTWLKENSQTTSGIWKISQKQIVNAPIPVPSLKRQKEIVQQIQMIEAHLSVLKKEISKSSAELDALPASILAQAFAGTL